MITLISFCLCFIGVILFAKDSEQRKRHGTYSKRENAGALCMVLGLIGFAVVAFILGMKLVKFIIEVMP